MCGCVRARVCVPLPLLSVNGGSLHPEDLWRKRALGPDVMTSPDRDTRPHKHRTAAAPSPESDEEVLEEEDE